MADNQNQSKCDDFDKNESIRLPFIEETLSFSSAFREETSEMRLAHSAGSLLRIGEYEIQGEIARGGMGVVYKAYHRRLERLAAVKLIRSGELAGAEEIDRFKTEAAAAAQLDHPNCVTVFDVGEHHGQHFIAFAYVDGPSLWKCISEAPLEPFEATRVTEQIARAVQFAHDRGIIHRDIKPQNILLTREGVPKLTDFGLAKTTHSSGGLTGTGIAIGTPSYMPPEQAAGLQSQVGPLSDVYSVGATFYALLTARPPFQASSAMETLMQVLHSEPISPRDLNPSVPRDLETICLKCLNKRTIDRYESSSCLADDLKRFLDGLPIRARPIGYIERTAKWVRRQPTAAALITVSFLAALAIVAVAVGLWYQRELEIESQLLASANSKLLAANLEKEEALKNVERHAYINRIAMAQRELQRNDFGKTEQLLEECPVALRGWEWHYYNGQLFPRTSIAVDRREVITKLLFSPNGRWIFMGNNKGVIRMRELVGIKSIEFPSHATSISAISLHPDGRTLITADEAGEVRTWALPSYDHRFSSIQDNGEKSIPKLLSIRRLGFPVNSLVVIGEDVYAALAPSSVSTANFPILRWKSIEDNTVYELPGHRGGVLSIACSRTNRLLGSGGNDRIVRVRELVGDKEVFQSPPLAGAVLGIAFSADEKWMYVAVDVAGQETEIKSYGCQEWTESTHRREPWYALRGMTLGYDESQIFLSTEGRIRLWDARGGRSTASLGYGVSIRHIAYDPVGGRIAAAGGTNGGAGVIPIWNIASAKKPRLLATPGMQVNAITLSRNGQRLATAGGSGQGKIWDVDTGHLLLTLDNKSSAMTAIAFSSDMRSIATGSIDKRVQLWNGATGELIHSCDGHPQSITSVQFNENGTSILTVGGDTRVWRIDGRPIVTIPGLAHGAGFAGSSGSSVLVTRQEIAIGRSDLLQFCDALSGDVLESHKIPSSLVIVDPSGKSLALGDGMGTVELFDLSSRKLRCQLSGDLVSTTCLAFSGDGERLLSTGAAGIKLWDSKTGREICSLDDTGNEKGLVAFAGNTLITTNAQGQLLAW